MSDVEPWRRKAALMVDLLGPLEPRVARVMREVPRHRFVPSEDQDRAYDDEPLPLRYGGATISAPHMVAIQLEWADLAPGLRVLEVGSGSGYLLALLHELVRPGGVVVGVEVEPRLVEGARRALDELGSTDVEIRIGDGAEGVPDRAPFDRIVVSCATPEILPAWRAQLRPDGTVVAPVGGSLEQRWVRWRNRPSGAPLEEGPACRFVPLLRAPRRHI